MKRMLALLVLILTSCAPTPTPLPPTTTPVVPTIAPVTPTGDSQYLPDPTLTPGALNPNVSQDNIHDTICVPGYSSSIRPPVSYTDALKVKQIVQYGYSDTNTADYEEDHFISLSIGGNPTDPRNLWPQPRNTQPYNAGVKDQLEFTLYKDVCNGTITLLEAQTAISTDWVAAYVKYGKPVLSLTPEP